MSTKNQTEFLSIHVLGRVDGLESPQLGLRVAFNRRRATPDGAVWAGQSYPMIKKFCLGDGRVVDYDGQRIGTVTQVEDTREGEMTFIISLGDESLLQGNGLWRAAMWAQIIDIKKRDDRPEERLVAFPEALVIWKEIPKQRTDHQLFTSAMQNVRRIAA